MMIRQRIKSLRGSDEDDSLFLLPLRLTSTRSKAASTTWLAGTMLLALFSMYCTWTFYPSSLDTQRQIAVVQSPSIRSVEQRQLLPPARRRSLQDRLQMRKIAWLLSFPNSGTTFTLANMEAVTNMSTATNYDNEILSETIYPLNPEHYEAPFVFSPHLELPKYVLTKTHCVGYCDHCHHSTITYDVSSFQFGCMKSTVKRNCWTDRKFYDVNSVKKAVHLVRDPFDNIVARMHLHVKERRKDKSVPVQVLDQFTETREGLAAWCKYVDTMFQDIQSHDWEQENGGYNQISNETMEQVLTVPCHSEWFRYTQWHNLTTALLDERLLERQVLYYEDYSSNFEQTVQRLADFMEQSIVHESLPFIAGKTYGHFYTDDEKKRIANLIFNLASKETWSVLSRYLEQYVDKEQKAVTATDSDTAPKVVWLMSFPQSGAKFVQNVVKTMSNASVGTQNGREVKLDTRKVWPDQVYSPMLSQPDMETPARVLTRTHCIGGAFDALPIEDYVVFSRNCRMVTMKEENKTTVGHFNMNMISGAITLVRNPSTVIHSRMTRRSRQLLNWSEEEWLIKRDSRKGLLEYCKRVDGAYTKRDKGPYTPRAAAQPRLIGVLRKRWYEIRLRYRRIHRAIDRKATCPSQWFASRANLRRYRFMKDEVGQEEFEYFTEKMKAQFRNHPVSEPIKKLFTDLPCYSEWLRYIQFYNYALDITGNIPGKIFYFEFFLKDYELVSQGLLDYLRLPRQADPPLSFNKTRTLGSSLYTAKESLLAAKLVRTLGSATTWDTLKVYFEKEDWYDSKELQGVRRINEN
ncbi:hypothetical protein MPSEU_000197100 [Mayamaea pseudoterrestris]|nr:hypothetical protein MPSEU_000197100 [Mayamaea pseudoterrestris]